MARRRLAPPASAPAADRARDPGDAALADRPDAPRPAGPPGPGAPGERPAGPPAARAPLARAPIAEIAGEAAVAGAEAARAAAAHAAAEAEGRLLLDLPLDAIDPAHLARDRAGLDPEAMAELEASLEARGQRTPAEVVRLDAPADPARPWGLISGWRRWTALQALHARTGEPRFARLRAVVAGVGGGADAYRAMVEENEIRAPLTPYERGRIAVLAAEAGAFADPGAAVDGLFAAASKAKRSKIRSFAAIHRAFGDVLAQPAALPERLGLRLAEAAREDGERARLLRATLAAAAPDRTAETERAVIAFVLDGKRKRRREVAGEAPAPGVRLRREPGVGGETLTITGLDRGSADRLAALIREALKPG